MRSGVCWSIPTTMEWKSSCPPLAAFEHFASSFQVDVTQRQLAASHEEFNQWAALQGSISLYSIAHDNLKLDKCFPSSQKRVSHKYSLTLLSSSKNKKRVNLRPHFPPLISLSKTFNFTKALSSTNTSVFYLLCGNCLFDSL
ncbi:hypothetical protein EGR_10802 [Echinococcus granulosus]|uniref:Uncharacterized protein n=1 Tax=Echinococcus granulosus TaxID=6210 RepID=W6ULD5_ECHGR|nr:hypothetical protein EGR_10802 [Echinococcus granulosus]EUB54339.1 hypothetical protein EGR_10802 [Echinococcus granulosus]